MVLEIRRPRRGITRYRPFLDLEDEDFFNRYPWGLSPSEERSWMPAVDVFEKDDKFIVKAELPGIKEEDIDVSVVGNTLSIKGEKKAETEVKNEDYYRCERTYGSFYRSILIPSTVYANKIEADFKDGILEVTLPKSAEVKPKKITVSAKKKASKETK